MTRVLRGIGVSPGVACAPALLIRWDFPEVKDRTVPAGEVENEVRRLRDAVSAVVVACWTGCTVSVVLAELDA